MQFLTTVPTPRLRAPSEEEVGESLLFYPVVGLIIGSILVGVVWLARDTILDVQAALVLSAWVLVTGALHLDGLADSADAWVGGLGNRERTLSIMKDPCTGPVGVAVIGLVFFVKFATVKGCLMHGQFLALVLSPTIGRAMVLGLFLTTPYVRADGLGRALADHLPRRGAYTVTLLATALPALLPHRAFWILVAGGLVFVGLRTLMIKRIGGITGDTAGALIELTESVVLMAVVFAH